MNIKTIDQAINYAASKLPEDCQINIMIENGGYGVEVQIPNGPISYEHISMEEGSIIDDIIVGTDTAIETINT